MTGVDSALETFQTLDTSQLYLVFAHSRYVSMRVYFMGNYSRTTINCPMMLFVCHMIFGGYMEQFEAGYISYKKNLRTCLSNSRLKVKFGDLEANLC